MAPFTMTRIDLRDRTLSAAQLRAALPRGGVDVDAVVPKVRPIVDAVAERGAEAALEYGESFDGVRPAPVRVPAGELRRALTELDADVRAALRGRHRRARAVHADQRRTDTTTTLAPGATVTERWVPVERVGLYVPGGNAVYPSSVVMNVVPAQTAGVDSLVIASPPQARVRRPAAPDDPGRRGAARRRRGVGGRRRPGRRAAGLRRHRHRRRRTRAGRHDHRPGQHLRHRGQADLPFAGRHRRRGRPDRDRDPRRPHRRSGARRRRPDQPGRARRDGRQRAGHAERRAGRRHRPRTGEPAGDHRAPRAGDRGADRQAVGDRARRRPRRRRAHGQRLRRRAPGDPDRSMRRDVASRIRSAGAIFVGAYSPVSLGDYCAGSNHVLPTAGCARHSSGLSVQTFLAASTSSTTTRRR